MGTGEGLSVELVKPGEDVKAEGRARLETLGQARTWGFGGVERRLVWAQMASEGQEGGRGSWEDRYHPDLQRPWKPGKGPELYLKYTRSRWHSVSGILARQRWPGFRKLPGVSTSVFAPVRWDDTGGPLTGLS